MRSCYIAEVSYKLAYFLNNKNNIFRRCNLIILSYLPGIEQSRISYFQALNTLR